MSSVNRPSTIEDEAQISELVARAFSAKGKAPVIPPGLLRWKYWAPCEDMPEPRSWVAERDGRIVAHLAIWQVAVKNGGIIERGVTGVDWAGDPETPGPGVTLMQMLSRRHDFAYTIGGTAMTQAILPRLGYRAVGEALTWARPLRPWKRMLRYEIRNLRLPLRVARNAIWSHTPFRSVPRGWSAVASGNQAPGDRSDRVPVIERGESFFRFLGQCPIAQCLTFHILHEGRKAGWFALFVGRVQARVAGLWLENPSSENWRIAFCLAQSAALEHTDACEFVARCSSEASWAGAERAGMRVRKRVPVFLRRKDKGSQLPPLEYHFCDDDGVFLNIQSARFLT
jgi:hypothetical protein